MLIVETPDCSPVFIVRSMPPNTGDLRDSGLIPESGRCLGESMAAHSGILAWRTPWAEEPGELPFMGSQRAGHWSEAAHTPPSKIPPVVPVCATSLQSCLPLCDPMDCSLPASFVRRILQARILQWVAMPSSRTSSQPRDRTSLSYVFCIGKQLLYH